MSTLKHTSHAKPQESRGPSAFRRTAGFVTLAALIAFSIAAFSIAACATPQATEPATAQAMPVPDEPKSGAVPADPLPGEDPFADATPRAELVIGDCLTVVLVRISCDQSHSYEVFRIIDHPALDISPYPDREALRAIYSHQDNIDAFHAYLGSDVGADGWVAPLITPDAEEWAAGDRLMLSLVSNTRTPDYLMTGSARGVLG